MSPWIAQWVALVFCVGGVAVRIRDLRSGRGRTIFVALVLLAAAVALSIPGIYLSVDSLLGGINVAHLVARYFLYVVVFLLGRQMAAAFGSSRAQFLVAGPPGLLVAGLCAATTFSLFAANSMPTSSPGLVAYTDQPLVRAYLQSARLYPMYIAATVVGPAAAACLARGHRTIHRFASGLVAAGMALVVVHGSLRLLGAIEAGPVAAALAFGGIALVVSGITFVWISRSRYESRGRLSALRELFGANRTFQNSRQRQSDTARER